MKVSTLRISPKLLVLSLIANVAASQAFAFTAIIGQNFDLPAPAPSLTPPPIVVPGPQEYQNNHIDVGSGIGKIHYDLKAHYIDNLEFKNINLVNGRFQFNLDVKGNCCDVVCTKSQLFGTTVHQYQVPGNGCTVISLTMDVPMLDMFAGQIKKTNDTSFVARLNPEYRTSMAARVKAAIAPKLDQAVIDLKNAGATIPGLVFPDPLKADEKTIAFWMLHNIWQVKILDRAETKIVELLSSEISGFSEESIGFRVEDQDTWFNHAFVYNSRTQTYMVLEQ